MNLRHSAEETARRIVHATLKGPAFLAAANAFNAFHGVRLMGWQDFRRVRALGHESGVVYPEEASLEPIHFRGYPHPFWVRPGTTDASELVHTVVRASYAVCRPEEPIRTIVDAGANVGDSTAWFLNTYPDATVIALEPDAANFDMLQRNCAPYGSRAVLLRAGLWYETRPLYVAQGSSPLDIHLTTEPPVADDAPETIPAYSPSDLMRAHALETVDIFKVDIEGAEVDLFESADCEWIRSVRSVVVDVHSDRAEQAVRQALAAKGFSNERYRELIVGFQEHSSM